MRRAGRCDRKIIIERATTSEDVIGAPKETFATLFSEFAEVMPISGRESLQSGREYAAETARFTMIYHSDVLPTDRINYDGKIWDIINIREIGRREQLEITAEARR